MPEALALSLRPTSFEDVIGSETVIKNIKRDLSGKGRKVAWLFSGPRGTGKTTLARIVARHLQGVDDGETLYENAANVNGIDAIREMVATANYQPFVGNCRVNILDEAHKLTAPAQECLLIPTENKDSPTVWMFCTTEPEKLVPTLRDRCAQHHLKGMTAAQLDALAARAAASVSLPPVEGFGELAVRSNVTVPREALGALEKIFSGTPIREALFRPEHAPEYADVARKVLSGNWTATQLALQQIKTADIGGLRSVLAAFFRSSLLKGTPGKATDAIANALIEMGNAAPHEQGVAYAVVTAILYRLAQRLA